MSYVLYTALLYGGAYLIGGFPSGVLVARARGGVNLRSIGSGNIGATNVYRALGMKWALLVFALDALKGALPAAIAAYAGAGPLELAGAGLIAVLGHVYNPYLKSGGKGVATGFGAVAVMSWPAALLALAVWAALLRLRGIVSLASLAAASALPLFVWLFERGEKGAVELALGAAAMAVLVIYSHKENIGRLLRGEEKKVARE